MTARDPLTREGLTARLTAPLAVELCPQVTSTNRLLRERAAAGAPEGATLLAESQTKGHGRFDRRFFSPSHTGLYLSVVLRPSLPAEQMALITPAAAVAVARALETVAGKQAGIKWVNDVYLEGRKVCGILTEAAVSGGRVDYAVLGIGLNVYAPEGGFPPELQAVAGAVAERSTPGLRDALAAAILNEFWRLYTALPQSDFMAEYRRRSVVVGRKVTVCRGGTETPATALDIDENGHLLVRYETGATETLGSGEISLRL